MPYGTWDASNMSKIVAPPVARGGLPTKPVMNRNTRNMGIFVANPVGSWSSVNTTSVQKYIELRPNRGISLSGDQSIGPRP